MVVAADGDVAETSFQVAFLLYVVLGMVVLNRRSRHPAGVLLSVVGGAVLGSAALDVLAHAAADPWARWGQAWLHVLGWNLGTTLLLLVLPDGTLPSPRWRWWVGVLGAASVLDALVVALLPGPLGDDPAVAHLRNPLGVEAVGPLLEPVEFGLVGLLTVGTLSGVLSLGLRWRRADRKERRKLAWVLLGVMVALGLLGLALAGARLGLSGSVPALAAAAFVAPAAGLAVGILREGLFDIELVVSRTVVYAAFVSLSVAAYAAAFAVASSGLVRDQGVAAALLAAGVVMAVLTSVQSALHRRVERLLFGDRRRASDVLQRLGAIAEHHESRAAELADLMSEVKRALRVPWVAVTRPGLAPVAVGSWSVDGAAERLPLAYGGRILGTLEVGLRAGDRFRPDELVTLASVAARIATSVWAVGAVEELSAARAGLVRSREAERIRIRRDLHDDVGPVLAAATLQVDALARRLQPGDEHGRELAARVKAELQTAVGELRTLLNDLRPPALDRGLIFAVRELARRLEDAGVEVRLHAGPLPPLDPAVETAAYRIVAEALTNVLRHSRATCCGVQLTAEKSALVVEVEDDGVGAGGPPGASDGVGLDSMRARAVELGGRLELLDTRLGTGTGLRVRAVIPWEVR